MGKVTVVIGAGAIGQAIARRISAGKHVLLADLQQKTRMRRQRLRQCRLRGEHRDRRCVFAGVGSRTCRCRNWVRRRHGGHPGRRGLASQASPATILAVDLYGTALVLEEFGNIVAPGGAGDRHRFAVRAPSGALTAEQDAALAKTPTEELLTLPMLQSDQVEDPLHAYQMSKRGNSLG